MNDFYPEYELENLKQKEIKSVNYTQLVNTPIVIFLMSTGFRV
jgi:hypothetical protein